MKATPTLEEFFSPEEISILEEITVTQLRAEMSAELPGGNMKNPYRSGMCAWVEGNLSSEDNAFMARALEIARKYDRISDKNKVLHRALIARVIGHGL